MENAQEILNAIIKHEELDRETLAFNVLNATKYLNLNEHKLCNYLAQICNLNPKTVYLWVAPEWTSKFTLKALTQISVALNIPLSVLLEEDKDGTKCIRSKKYRVKSSCENYVLSYAKRHPEATSKDIALCLGLNDVTVRRHLKKLNKGERK